MKTSAATVSPREVLARLSAKRPPNFESYLYLINAIREVMGQDPIPHSSKEWRRPESSFLSHFSQHEGDGNRQALKRLYGNTGMFRR